MLNLDLIDFLPQTIKKKKIPTLGICLGAQLLLSHSEEGKKPGLDLVEGYCKKFDKNLINEFKIPNMGWLETHFIKNTNLSKNFEPNPRFYFVHSYHFVPDNFNDCRAFADYGEHVTAIIARDNKIGTQFHPEKSQKAGLNLISAFLNWHI